MSFTSTRRAFILSVFAVAALPMAGCGKSKPEPRQVAPYEGQYKNAKGEVVLEIKEGTVRYTNPNTKTKSETSYMVQGTDKLFVESDVGEFTLVIAPDGSITGLPAAIAGGTAPIKKS